MKTYQSKARTLPGTSYDEVQVAARKEHNRVVALTKRQPYARSAYFNKSKVFLSAFWEHTMQKHRKVRTERLKLYAAAIDLIRNSRHDPETIIENNNPSILLHRFYGVTRDRVAFCIQIKQNKRTGRLDLLSAFKRTYDETKKPSAL